MTLCRASSEDALHFNLMELRALQKGNNLKFGNTKGFGLSRETKSSENFIEYVGKYTMNFRE